MGIVTYLLEMNHDFPIGIELFARTFATTRGASRRTLPSAHTGTRTNALSSVRLWTRSNSWWGARQCDALFGRTHFHLVVMIQAKYIALFVSFQGAHF
jgi:hypothetical protein